MDSMIYDCEIIKAIPPRNGKREPGILYCGGWEDHANMGISCICAYDYKEDRYRVFLQDNLNEFQELANERVPIGFNSQRFDDQLCKANGIEVQSEDILADIWESQGLSRTFQYPSHIGFSLDAIATANGIMKKTGNGALAPILWQKGKRGAVIDYCLADVAITRAILELAQKAFIVNPKDPSKTIKLPVYDNELPF